jgi:hypothetical protein
MYKAESGIFWWRQPNQTKQDMCWNFGTIFGGLEPSKNRIVVPARKSPNFKTFKEPKTRFQGINSASMYDNPIPTPILHRMFKIPAQATEAGGIGSLWNR